MLNIIAAPSEVLYSTFKIKNHVGPSSGFFYQYNEEIFFVTASHCIENIYNDDNIGININFEWSYRKVKKVIRSMKSDVCVLAMEGHCPAELCMKIGGKKGLALGQEALIAGFPLGYEMPAFNADLQQGRIFPMLKKGIYSGDAGGRPFFDVYVNKGFSGGPIVVNSAVNMFEAQKIKVVGVVSSYKFDRPLMVMRKHPDGSIEETEYYIKGNSGFTEAACFDDVIEIMDRF